MTTRARRPALLALAVLTGVATSACSATTYDTAATTVPADEAVPTTSFVPTGSTGELLEQLGTETAGLSDMLVENDGQARALVRVEAIWALIRPDVATDRPELLEGFDTVIDLVRRSVERRRPADADKAHKNLLTLIAAYQR
ncbi:MAG: hypothetical protein ABW195_19060 [Ilumatobacteraceae bacterium]